MQTSRGKIILGDCLEVMKTFEDNQFDLVLTDPPYGTTAIDWDTEVDFMDEALRVAPIVVLTSSQPYTSKMVVKYIKYFKHEWIWEKNKPTNIFQAEYAPMKQHETVLVFAREKYTFNPQRVKRSEGGMQRTRYTHKPSNTDKREYIGNFQQSKTIQYDQTEKNPYTIIFFDNEVGLHPTQKPVALFKYLIRTYTNEGDDILDPFAGSGTTLRAAKDLNRQCTVIEINPKYVEIIKKRERQEVLL